MERTTPTTGTTMTDPGTSASQHVYEIRVEGHLGSQWASWFDGLTITLADDGETVLAGPLDQAALHGVFRKVRDLGLPLVSVVRTKGVRS
jgi:hypothetical protein